VDDIKTTHTVELGKAKDVSRRHGVLRRRGVLRRHGVLRRRGVLRRHGDVLQRWVRAVLVGGTCH
jgi:hypothetical protein